MDYVDWVEQVHREVTGTFDEAPGSLQLLGVTLEQLVQRFGLDVRCQSDVWTVQFALNDLVDLGLLRTDELSHFYTLTQDGRRARDASPLLDWGRFFAVFLEPMQQELLARVCDGAQQTQPPGVLLRWVVHRDILAASSLDVVGKDEDEVLASIRSLSGEGLVQANFYADGRAEILPTYAGFVRATRSAQHDAHKLVTTLLSEWETTNVDFKRELNLKRDRDKAEFVRDALGLTNTKASGRRFLVIGFDDKSQEFVRSVDRSVTQERLEQILHAYCEPTPGIQFHTVPWCGGTVGVIEFSREAHKLPYMPKKSMGPLKTDVVYVRHGRHTEAATTREREDLVQEGKRARAEAEAISQAAT